MTDSPAPTSLLQIESTACRVDSSGKPFRHRQHFTDIGAGETSVWSASPVAEKRYCAVDLAIAAATGDADGVRVQSV